MARPKIPPPSPASGNIPPGVWILGFVSLLMDVSSEMIHSLLPVFMVSSLGASATAVGLVEGAAEATALIVKLFSGMLSDFIGRRKELAVFGYGLGAVSKPLFAMARAVPDVMTARFLDRIGKGVRGAPRDALIADMTAPVLRGQAYGLRQSLDTFGAFLGPLAAITLMWLWRGDFRRVFWAAAAPGLLAAALLAVGIQESNPPATPRPRSPINRAALLRLGPAYWRIVIVGAAFTLARFSEAFLVLKARERGLSDGLAPLVFVTMNIVFAACAYPAGVLADRFDRRALVALGLFALIAADLTLARSSTLAVAAIGIVLWGIHLGLTQGVFSAMVASSAPESLRGSAFGFFNLASGVAMLISSAVAGILWDARGPAATFYAGAGLSAAALGAVGALRP